MPLLPLRKPNRTPVPGLFITYPYGENTPTSTLISIKSHGDSMGYRHIILLFLERIMAYRTILTVLTADADMDQLEAAIVAARRHEAHLEVFCLGIDRAQAAYYFAGTSAYVFQENVDAAMETADRLAKAARARLSREDLSWAVEAAAVQSGGLATLVGMRARYSDLAIQLRRGSESKLTDSDASLEAALFDGGAPMLVVPQSGLAADYGRRVMVGWNQSEEAMTAVRRALPLMQKADLVEITVIDPSPHGPERSDPGGALCHMLARHGVRCEIAVLARTLPQTSQILMQRAMDTGADLLVVGAYSHSRFRQSILGGTTRNLLSQCKIPILMAR